MIVFHIRVGKYARAFYPPRSLWQELVLLRRGWRPSSWYGRLWYTKPSRNQRQLERT
jgi:hypothetical protein